MLNEDYESSDEEVVNLIFDACIKNSQGLLNTSDLIYYLETSNSCINDTLREDLLSHFEGHLLTWSDFRCGMLSWIASQRKGSMHSMADEHNIVSHKDVEKFDEVVSSPSDFVVIEELKERLRDLEESGRRHAQQKATMEALLEDVTRQHQLELDRLNKRYTHEVDVVRQASKEAEERARALQQTLQFECEQLQATVASVGQATARKEEKVAELLAKLQQQGSDYCDSEEALQKMKQQLSDVIDEKEKLQESLCVYQMLYSEKNEALETQEGLNKILKQDAEALKMEIQELRQEAAERFFNTTQESEDAAACSNNRGVSLLSELTQPLMASLTLASPLVAAEESPLTADDFNTAQCAGEERLEVMKQLDALVETVKMQARLVGHGDGGGDGDDSAVDAMKTSMVQQLLAAMNEKLQAELNFVRLRASFAQQIEAFEQQQSSMKEIVRQLQLEVREREGDAEGCREILKEREERLALENVRLQEKVAEMEEEKRDMEEKKRDMEEKKRDMEEKKKDMENEERDIEKEKNELEKEKRDVEKEKRELEKEKRDVEKEKRELERKVEEWSKRRVEEALSKEAPVHFPVVARKNAQQGMVHLAQETIFTTDTRSRRLDCLFFMVAIFCVCLRLLSQLKATNLPHAV